jgi:hypothetical protein
LTARSTAIAERRRGLALLAAFVALVPVPAFAQAGQDADRAETLFQSAKARMAAGDYITACPTFAESYRLDPGTGTLLALALCHEREGKIGSAWKEFKQAREAAAAEGRHDRQTLAEEHLATIGSQVSRVTVLVGFDPPASFVVRLDGADLAPASLGIGVPVDPGDHRIEAIDGGRNVWATTFKVGPKADARTVVIPKLALRPEPAREPSEQAERGRGRGLPLSVPILGAVGVAALGVGTYFGFDAIGKRRDATSMCPSSPCANAEGVSRNREAQTAATVSTIGFAVGVGALVVGTVLLLTSSKGARP